MDKKGINKIMQFNSSEEMEKTLLNDEIDLYCPEIGYYIFKDSEDIKAFALYRISREEAKVLAEKARQNDSYWGAFLGVGGHVYHGEECEDFFQEYYKYNWEVTI